MIWINGREAVRHRVAAGSSLEALATGEKGDAGFAHYPHSFVADAGLLTTGRNVIAVEVHNAAGNSALLWFDLQLERCENKPCSLAFHWRLTFDV